MRELPVGESFVVQLYQSDKWEGSVTWCQVMAGGEYQHGFLVNGTEEMDSVAEAAVREAERWIARPHDDR